MAIELYRSAPRYLGARVIGGRMPGLLSGPVAPLRLVDRDEPRLPGEGWVRLKPLLSGICGSDLNTISGGSSFYFSALVSMPFVPGHEVVATLLDSCPPLQAGQRVVVDPVLGCAARGVDPACRPCSSGQGALCERVTTGHLTAGIQTGYCKQAPGGWGSQMVAHSSQLHPVPEEMADEAAVFVEPLACAIHAVRRAEVGRDATVLIVGAGAVGLATLVALRALTEAGRIIVAAKHQAQAEAAHRYGAEVVSPAEALGTVRRATAAFRLEPERSPAFLLGGADVSFETAGSASALGLALRATRGRGRVVMAGMPAGGDLSPAWYRELDLCGAYCGTGCFPEAIELAAAAEVGKLVGPAYPLSRWREAVEHAFSAGRSGSIKVVFDPRLD